MLGIIHPPLVSRHGGGEVNPNAVVNPIVTTTKPDENSNYPSGSMNTPSADNAGMPIYAINLQGQKVLVCWSNNPSCVAGFQDTRAQVSTDPNSYPSGGPGGFAIPPTPATIADVNAANAAAVDAGLRMFSSAALEPFRQDITRRLISPASGSNAVSPGSVTAIATQGQGGNAQTGTTPTTQATNILNQITSGNMKGFLEQSILGVPMWLVLLAGGIGMIKIVKGTIE